MTLTFYDISNYNCCSYLGKFSIEKKNVNKSKYLVVTVTLQGVLLHLN